MSLIDGEYTKKSITVKAFRWHISMGEYGGVISRYKGEPKIYEIPTLEGHHIVSDGDWIITGVKGEKYPCKPDIFEMTYESGNGKNVTKDDIFIKHIKEHLQEGQEVVCKICGKTAKEITDTE